MTFSEALLARCATAIPFTATSLIVYFCSASAAKTFVGKNTTHGFTLVHDPVDPTVVYVNFTSVTECTAFKAAIAPYAGPALTIGRGTLSPVFNVNMLPPLPAPTAGPEPKVSVFLFARARTVIPEGVTFSKEITNGVMVCFADVPVSAISKDDREDSKGTHKVTIKTSVFSLSKKPEHRLGTSHAIECWEQWQRTNQALETWKKDCAAVREIFFLRGEYLTTMPYSGRTRHLTPGQEPVLYRIPTSAPASAPAPAPASAQVVALHDAPKIGKRSVCRTTSWDDDEVDKVETTCSLAKPVMSEMELIVQEMTKLEASNKATEAFIASEMEAKKAAEESIAHEKTLVAMRSQRDALVAKQFQLKATKEALQAATQALRSA
jgi:hypothetical protein